MGGIFIHWFCAVVWSLFLVGSLSSPTVSRICGVWFRSTLFHVSIMNMIGDANLTGASLKYASMNSRQCENTQSIGPEPRIDVKPTNGAEASLISTRWRLGYPRLTRWCASRHMRSPSQRTYHPQRLTTPPMTRTLPALAISESAPPSITTTPPIT